MRDLEATIRNALRSALPYLKAINGDSALKVLTGSKVPYSEQASYESGTFFLQHITDTPQGPDYYKLVVIDMDGDRASTLKTATAFARDGYVFKRNAADPPIYVAPLWEFRLQPTGVRI